MGETSVSLVSRIPTYDLRQCQARKEYRTYPNPAWEGPFTFEMGRVKFPRRVRASGLDVRFRTLRTSNVMKIRPFPQTPPLHQSTHHHSRPDRNRAATPSPRETQTGYRPTRRPIRLLRGRQDMGIPFLGGFCRRPAIQAPDIRREELQKSAARRGASTRQQDRALGNPAAAEAPDR